MKCSVTSRGIYTGRRPERHWSSPNKTARWPKSSRSTTPRPRRPPRSAREALRDPANEVFLSVVSLWEAIIKYQLGKLPLPQPPHLYLPTQRARHRIASLTADEASVARVASLPPLNRDPFDRLLIAQALQHGLTLLTVDAAILAYPSVSLF
jgi:PIN domain nuclease of toxin-antitoxin system